MEDNNKPLTPGQVLDHFPLLKREKLNYWAQKGYLPTISDSRGNRNYTLFPRDALNIIQQAHDLILVGKMKDREAFILIQKNEKN